MICLEVLCGRVRKMMLVLVSILGVVFCRVRCVREWRWGWMVRSGWLVFWNVVMVVMWNLGCWESSCSSLFLVYLFVLVMVMDSDMV